MPFRLIYGTDALIPIKVVVTSMRREAFNEDSNGDLLRVNLDCLDEVRDEASQKMTRYQQKMVEYYNKRVKLRRLNIGDLVLRRVTLATKDPTQAWTNLGRSLQGHPLLKTRQLPPGDNGREEVTTAMEHRASEKISSINVKYHCIHESDIFI